MLYCSTRDDGIMATASRIIVKGISDDGGLFVPAEIPKLLPHALGSLSADYSKLASKVIALYFDDFAQNTIDAVCGLSYSDNFANCPVSVHKLEEGLFSLELWHGPTLAFKDMALQLLPRLMCEAKRINNIKSQSLLLVATSGDTGKAALEGFRDVDGVGVCVFYPLKGVSEIQRKQMTTQRGENLFVAAVDGTFDDAQRAVKSLMTERGVIDELAEMNIQFTSANSINFGRLAPQIVYYYSSYLHLIENGEIAPGDEVNFSVPSGNFGNILAGYLAKEMGLPINKLICASNKNDVLTEFIRTGVYDANRDFYTTSSPSMDILVSSNVERLVWWIAGRDAKRTKRLYESFQESRRFSLSERESSLLKESFSAFSCDERDTKKIIKTVFDTYGYLIDPHTAVGFEAVFQYREQSGDSRPVISLSTASPFKFATSVLSALGETETDGFAALSALSEYSGTPIPERIGELNTLEERFTDIFRVGEEKKALQKFLQK